MNDIREREREKEEGHLKLRNRNNPTPPSLCSISPLLHLQSPSPYVFPLFSFLYIMHRFVLRCIGPLFFALPLTNYEGSFRVSSFSYVPMTLTCQKSGGVKTSVASVVCHPSKQLKRNAHRRIERTSKWDWRDKTNLLGHWTATLKKNNLNEDFSSPTNFV